MPIEDQQLLEVENHFLVMRELSVAFRYRSKIRDRYLTLIDFGIILEPVSLPIRIPPPRTTIHLTVSAPWTL